MSTLAEIERLMANVEATPVRVRDENTLDLVRRMQAVCDRILRESEEADDLRAEVKHLRARVEQLERAQQPLDAVAKKRA